MKYITVPSDVQIRPPREVIGRDPNAKPETLSFRKYAFSIWLDDSRAIEGSFVKQQRWAKVIAKFDDAEPGDVLELEDEDHATLLAIVQTPKLQLPPSVTVQCLSFSLAVVNAPSEKPEPAARLAAE